MTNFQFKSQVATNRISTLDPDWVREVREHAKWVAVRLYGMYRREFGRDDRNHQRWEGSMMKIVGSRKTAFLVVPHRFPHARSWRNNTRQYWVGVRGRRARDIAPFLRYVRAETNCKLLVHVEDVSARWVYGMDWRPDLWVMDNPMLSEAEVLAWEDLLDHEGVVRRSALRPWHFWDRWGMPVQRAELYGQWLPKIGLHGQWPPTETVRWGTLLKPHPMRSWLRPEVNSSVA